MATSVADLSINVSANIAQAVQGMDRLRGVLSRTSEQLDGLNRLGKDFAAGFAGALAGAFSVSAITEMVTSVVRAAASLDDLSEKTGASVESLSRFAGVARITGQDLGSVESSMNKLSKSLAEAQDGGSNAAKAFASFGINIRDASGNLKNSGEVMDELARKQQGFGDGAGKSAAMMQLLGRSGAELIPFLNDYVRLSGEVTETTTEQAQQAEDLQIQIGLLQEKFNALVRNAILPLIPQIREVISSFESLGKTVANLSPQGKGPLEGFLESIRETNRETIGEIAFLKQAFENLKIFWKDASWRDIGNMAIGKGQPLAGQISPAAARDAAMLAEANRELARATSEIPPLMESTATATNKAAISFSTGKAGVDKFGQSLGAMQKVLRDAEASAMALGRATGDQVAPSLQRLADIMASPAWATFSKTQRETITQTAENAAGVWRMVEAYKELAASAEAVAKIINDNNNAQFASSERTRTALLGMVEGWKAQSEEIAFQITLIGKTAEEQERLTAIRRIDLEVQRQLNELGDDYYAQQGVAIIQAGEAAKKQLEANLALRNSMQGQADFLRQQQEIGAQVFDALTNRGAEFIQDFAKNGSSAFRRLWEDFQSWALAALAKIAAQEIVVSIAGSFGASGGGALGGLLGGGGGGGIGDILGGLGSLFGGGGGGGGGILGGLIGGIGSSLSAGLFSSLGGAGAAQAAALAAQTAGFGLAGTSATLAALGGVGGAMGAATTAVLAAVPVVGWIAAAGIALYSIFGGDDSVPKTGGSGGRAVNLDSGTNWELERRMFTPNDSDEAVQKFVDSIATGFTGIAAALGINTGTFGFHLGYDAHEEHGNRVSALVQDAAGGTIYEAKDVGVGDDIQGSLELYAKRSILAALQASDMPQYLADVFSALDVSSAAEAEIDAAIEFAQGLKIVVAAVQGLGDQFSAIKPEDIQGFVEAFGGLENMIKGISFIGENFYTDAQKLATATATLDGVFDDLGVSVPQTHQEFLDLLNGLDLSTDAGREFYQALVAIAPLWVQVNGSAQDAVDNLADVDDELEEVADSANDAAKAIASIDMGTIANQSRTLFDGIKERMESLAGAVDGPLGDQLTVKLSATQNEIDRISESMYDIFARGMGGTAEYQKFAEVLRKLNEYQAGTAQTLARYTVLAAQFDAERAGELVNLEAWYAEQKKIFSGNSEALAALQVVFDGRWQAIVDGVAGGVDGTIDELERLRGSLADWLKSLNVGALSPLKPLEQLDLARQQFEERFNLASTGDQAALGDITKFADQYLTLARDLYKSSETYTGIFDMVTAMVAQLAGTDQRGMPVGDTFVPAEVSMAALAASMPANGERLASSDDMRAYSNAMQSAFEAALAAHADANSAEAEQIREELRALRRTLDAKLELMK